MKSKKKSKNTRFIDLARHRRREKCLKIKNDLRHGVNCGKNFVTMYDLSASPDHGWMDIYFLSKKDPAILYVAALVSSLMELSEKIDEKAYDEHEELFPDYDQELTFEKFDKNLSILVWGKKSMPEHDRYGWVKNRKAELAKEALPPIYENVRLDYSYRSGIGLHATLKQETFTKEDIDAFIEDFWANGEKEYIADTPIVFGKESIDSLIEKFF